MRIRFPLYAQTLCILLLQLALLFVLFLTLFDRQFGFGWEAIMHSPIGDQVNSMAWDISHQLRDRPMQEWNGILDDSGKMYGVKFYIFDNHGDEVAGDPIQLPESVRVSLIRRRHQAEVATIDRNPNQSAQRQRGRFLVHTNDPDSFWVGARISMISPEDRARFGSDSDRGRNDDDSIDRSQSSTNSGQSRIKAGGTAENRGQGGTEREPEVRSQGRTDGEHEVRSQGRTDGEHEVSTQADTAGKREVAAQDGTDGQHEVPTQDGTTGKLAVSGQDGTAGKREVRSQGGTNGEHDVSTQVGTAGKREVSGQGGTDSDLDARGQTERRGEHRRGERGTAASGRDGFHSGTLVARSQNLWQSRIFMDFGVVSAIVLGILASSILLWWPFAYRIVSSLSRLTFATEKIAQGSFDVALKPNDFDEIGRLSTGVSIMSERLQKYVTGQKRFLGDIAHELCSPVSRLQIALELLRNSATPQQERMLNNIAIEVEEMKELVDELLAFTKSELGTTPELVPVLLEPLVKNAISKECAGCDVTCEIPDALYVMGSAILIERAFANVLRNAVRYAGKDGPTRIKALRSGQDVSVCIRDSGPGAPPEALSSLAEPFYRPEASRNRNSGGVGLGLAIVKTCIESCDGTFSLRNIEPSGLEVEFRFKVASQQPALVSDLTSETV